MPMIVQASLTCNQAGHFSIKQYLTSVQTEHATCRITPRQPPPLFFSKIRGILHHLRFLISHADSFAKDKYIYARDSTFFILEFYTGQRASDIGRIKTVYVLRNKSLLINQRGGKSLKSLSRPIPIRPSANPAMCPVTNLLFLRTLCRAMKIDLKAGFLFRATLNHR